MSRRTIRNDTGVNKAALLEALGVCRRAVLDATNQMRVGGPLYYACHTVTSAIDALALMLTGEPGYFALRPHSTSDISGSGRCRECRRGRPRAGVASGAGCGPAAGRDRAIMNGAMACSYSSSKIFAVIA